MNRKDRERASRVLRGVDREDGAMAAAVSQCVSIASPVHMQVCRIADQKKKG